MKFGLPISLGAHGAVIGASWLGFTIARDIDSGPQVIPVKILSISNESNVRAARKEVTPPIAEPENIAPRSVKPLEADTVADSIPAPKPVVADPVEPEEEAKTESTKPDPKPVKPKPLSLDDLSALVAQSKEKMDSTDTGASQQLLEGERNQIEIAAQDRAAIGAGDGLTTGYEEAIMRRVYNSWRIPSGAPDIESLVVTVDVTLDEEGRVTSARLTPQSARQSARNDYYRTAAESAVRAVNDAEQFKFLPRSEYARWQRLSLTFLPKDAPTGVPT